MYYFIVFLICFKIVIYSAEDIIFPKTNYVMIRESKWSYSFAGPYVRNVLVNVDTYPNFPAVVEKKYVDDLANFTTVPSVDTPSIANYTTSVDTRNVDSSFALCFAVTKRTSNLYNCISFGIIDGVNCSSTRSQSTGSYLFTVGDNALITCDIRYTGVYLPRLVVTSAEVHTTTSIQHPLRYTLAFKANRDSVRNIQMHVEMTSATYTTPAYNKEYNESNTYSGVPVLLGTLQFPNLHIMYQEKASFGVNHFQSVYEVGSIISVVTFGFPIPSVSWIDVDTGRIISNTDNSFLITSKYLKPTNQSFIISICNTILIRDEATNFCEKTTLEFQVVKVTATTTVSTETSNSKNPLPPTTAKSQKEEFALSRSQLIGLIVGLLCLAIIIIIIVVFVRISRNRRKEFDQFDSKKISIDHSSTLRNQSYNDSSQRAATSMGTPATLEDVTGVNNNLHTIDDVPRSRRPLKVFEPNQSGVFT